MYAADQRGRDAVEQLLHISQAKPVLTPPAPPRLGTISAAEISETHFEETPHIVQSLLPVGLTVFAAPPKTGKSWFCLALSEAVAHGLPFFGRSTLKGDVLYLDLESRAVRVQGRMRRMKCKPPQNLDLAFSADDLQHGLLEQLTAWHEAHPAGRLVIIDTFARVKGAAPRNADAYSADSRLLSPLQRWALDRNIAVVLVTHLRKQTRYAADADVFELITGSNGQFGIVDTAWLVTGQRTDEQRHLRITGRDIDEQDLIITLDRESCRWKYLGAAESVQRMQAVKSPIVRTIVALLNESTEKEIRMTSTDIISESVDRFGSCELATPSELGKKLRELAPLFAELGVVYILPGKNGGKYGRRHVFKRGSESVRTEQLSL